MGDSAVILAFPYGSDLSNETKQGNPMLALGESISFGRFMSESLSWEKWSSFSHKKYVEEAERYSQPGTVAQKKAFFEAHYKRIADQKAAALLEQENSVVEQKIPEAKLDDHKEEVEWRYSDLGDLPFVRENAVFHIANAGFSYDYQLVDVPDYHGRGETAPSPWFYQNEGEAEYVVSVYMYMRLLGYPANKISILTTYNGQKLLIRDVINRRCLPYDFIGPPHKVTTVDKFQGQQNDFILLSLVRTRFVGHLRDVRRLVVAMSRARLGLYVFCRRSLFEQCYELQPTFQLLLQRPDRLALNLNEVTTFTNRRLEDTGQSQLVSGIEEMANIVNYKMHQVYEARVMSHQLNEFSAYSGQVPLTMDASEENGLQNPETSVHLMDVHNHNSANGADEDIPDSGNSNESMQQEASTNGNMPFVNNLYVETGVELQGDGINGAAIENSKNDERKMEE